MALQHRSYCVNHSAVEAVARCKTCRKPVCATCVVGGATGQFCSEECKEKHEQFIQRAQQLERAPKPRPAWIHKSWIFFVRFVILAVIVIVAAVVADLFADIRVPFVSDILHRFVP